VAAKGVWVGKLCFPIGTRVPIGGGGDSPKVCMVGEGERPGSEGRLGSGRMAGGEGLTCRRGNLRGRQMRRCLAVCGELQQYTGSQISHRAYRRRAEKVFPQTV
jgi:hypothetical protein